MKTYSRTMIFVVPWSGVQAFWAGLKMPYTILLPYLFHKTKCIAVMKPSKNCEIRDPWSGVEALR